MFSRHCISLSTFGYAILRLITLVAQAFSVSLETMMIHNQIADNVHHISKWRHWRAWDFIFGSVSSASSYFVSRTEKEERKREKYLTWNLCELTQYIWCLTILFTTIILFFYCKDTTSTSKFISLVWKLHFIS